MGQLINLTQGIISATTDTTQPLANVVDVLGAPGGRIDLLLRVYSFAGSSTPSMTVKVSGSMYNDSSAAANWALLGTFAAVTGVKVEALSLPTSTGGAVGCVFRYLQWSVSFTGTIDACAFEVLGVAW